ncbi:calcium-binding protein [Rhizobium sp. 862_C5_N1_2]|uniref:calcium-binding protein n=1 Tax=Rhizobium sp. 862_C5_N1_2 TaxID=3276277 RepID=UPI003F1F1335
MSEDVHEAALTEQEMAVLQSLLDAHDRAGFYMTYQAMFDNPEAALQARISSFSGPVGGVALGANRLLQFAFGSDPGTGDLYPGIYNLSQRVAASAFSGIHSDLDNGGSGNIDENQFFNTAVDAWSGPIENLFPGQLIIKLYEEPTTIATVMATFVSDYMGQLANSASLIDALRSAISSSSVPGIVVSALATLTADMFGKSASDMLAAGYSEVSGPNGYTLYVDTHGKVGAVLGMDINDAQVIAAQSAAHAAMELAFSPFGGTAAYELLQEAIGGVIWPSDYGTLDPSHLTESNTTSFNGDLQGPLTASVTPGMAHWSGEGTSNADILAGTEPTLGFFGNDVMRAGAGNDLVLGGGGNDEIHGESGDDIIWGQEDDDQLFGEGGNDLIRGGQGDDLIHAGEKPGEDYTPPEDEDVPLTIDVGDDKIDAGAGNDTVYISEGKDIVVLGDGDDEIYLAETTSEELPYQAQASMQSIIWGGEGADKFHFMESANWKAVILYADNITANLVLNLDQTKLFADLESEFGDVNYVILNPDYDDKFYSGDALLQFEIGSKTTGGSHGYGSNPVTPAGYEIDGVPVYRFDTWTDEVTEQTTWNYYWKSEDGEQNGILYSPGTGVGDGTAFSENGSYYTSINVANGYSFQVIEGFTDGTAGIQFEKNTDVNTYTVTKADYQLLDYTSDYISSTLDADGLDVLVDGLDSVFTGLDVFPDPLTGTLGSLKETNVENVFEPAVDTLISDEYGNSKKYRIDLTAYQLSSTEPNNPTNPTPINGTPNDDTINGSSNDDVINSGDGDDLISGLAGNDSIDGGLGADVMFGGEGNDTYIVDSASDVVSETSTTGGTDLVQASASFVLGSNVENLTLTGTSAINAIGNSAINVLSGNFGDNTLEGGGGDDILLGSAGSDTYAYASGDGSDIIDDEAGFTDNIDVLDLLDLNAADLSFVRYGNDLAVVVAATGEIITVDEQFRSETEYWGLERIDFADGTSWDRSQIQAAAQPDYLVTVPGTAVAETLEGTWGDDVIRGFTGDDLLLGSAGSDVYVYASGDGNDLIDDEAGFTDNTDVLALKDLNAADLAFIRYGNDLAISVTATGQTITVDDQFYSATEYWGLERIDFANGSSWDRSQILAAAQPDYLVTVAGTAVAETLEGTWGDDVIRGFAGDDELRGSAGSDIYVFASGDGNDLIDDEAGFTDNTDVLALKDLNAADLAFIRYGNDLAINVAATGETITVDDQFYSETEYWGLERIDFADGSSWDRSQIQAAAQPDYLVTVAGTAAAETLEGTFGDDVIRGFAGDDLLLGSAGSDIYVYAAGDGSDTIDDEAGFTDNTDILVLKNLNASDLTFARSGNDLVIGFNGSVDSITIDEEFYSESEFWGIEQINFADGSSWNRTQIWDTV